MKLTHNQIVEIKKKIRDEWCYGMGNKLAKEYGVCVGTIYKIRKGQTFPLIMV